MMKKKEECGCWGHRAGEQGAATRGSHYTTRTVRVVCASWTVRLATPHSQGPISSYTDTTYRYFLAEIEGPDQKSDSEAEKGLLNKRRSHLLRVKKLSDNAVLPSRASPLSPGYDLSSSVRNFWVFR
ncbi:Deoxyuridine 5'-triphosphate nucleotidohydrolase [Arachis hypogaea]|uniref:Deoxyuridine 5'-triphosphate nucleotidohydrolase n=1 Tax=Arachis hypogaea TaxID=3818 RepID=A0A6B9VBR7_ARAHY|nr:Deoxyuridine 5'-triphosphate nucleotidohydrolase [Arachis hypogaea]